MPSGILLTPLSVDIIFHETLGQHPGTSDPVCGNDVVAIFIGPPCSTWSISRWRHYVEEESGPRPVRSVMLPFGIEACRIGELRDLLLGYVLLFFALTILAVQAAKGRIGLLEHPSPRDVEKYPSIWSLAAYKALHGFSCFTEIVIQQGLFGAASPKPTTLGICGAPDPYRVIRSFEVTKVLPPPLKMGKGSSAGVGNSASYSTSALKEYPEALCKAMAMLAVQWLISNCPEMVFDSASSSSTDEDLRKPFMADLEGLYERGADTRGHRTETN